MSMAGWHSAGEGRGGWIRSPSPGTPIDPAEPGENVGFAVPNGAADPEGWDPPAQIPLGGGPFSDAKPRGKLAAGE